MVEFDRGELHPEPALGAAPYAKSVGKLSVCQNHTIDNTQIFIVSPRCAACLRRIADTQ